MRARKRDKNNLMKVGIFITALTLILLLIIGSIGNENSLFKTKIEIKAQVENASNLKQGSYVELKGINIGTVTDIEIVSEDKVEITMKVIQDELKWIKQDSVVAISSAGLVGDKYLEIKTGTQASPLFDPTKDVLKSEGAGSLEVMMTHGKAIAASTESILIKLDKLLNSLGDGKAIVGTVNSINDSMGRLNHASGSIERVMSRIEKGPGTMNSLIYDDSLHEKLRTILGGAERNKVIKFFIRQSIKNSEDNEK